MYLLANSPIEETIILQDNFSNLDNWSDLTSLISWGNYPVGTSGFSTGINEGQQAVFLNPADADEDEIDTTTYTGFTQPEDLKSFTALDFAFPEPIIHQAEILTIEFDARWDSVTDSGEAGRFMVVLMDDYPDDDYIAIAFRARRSLSAQRLALGERGSLVPRDRKLYGHQFRNSRTTYDLSFFKQKI